MEQTMTSVPQKHTPAEALMRPGANSRFFVWLALLGIPALLLFLIYGKTIELQLQEQTVPPVSQQEHVAH